MASLRIHRSTGSFLRSRALYFSGVEVLTVQIPAVQIFTVQIFTVQIFTVLISTVQHLIHQCARLCFAVALGSKRGDDESVRAFGL
jgi:hypothetical protein